jgi:hypothetical protein
VRAAAEKSSSAVIGMVRGIPLEPVASWPPEVAPSLSVMRESKWILIADYEGPFPMETQYEWSSTRIVVDVE